MGTIVVHRVLCFFVIDTMVLCYGNSGGNYKLRTVLDRELYIVCHWIDLQQVCSMHCGSEIVIECC